MPLLSPIRVLGIILTLVAVSWPGIALSQDLPLAAEVIERSIEAAGGKAAFANVSTRTASGTIDTPSMGLKGTVTIYQSRPDKMLTIMNLEGVGIAKRGHDGDLFWEVVPMTGARIYEGKEKDVMVLLSQFERTDFRQHFKSVETAGIEVIEGEKCYKVVATPKTELKPITTYYSVETGLPVRLDYILESQLREIAFENYYSDYRKVGRLLLPHTAIQKMEGFVTTVIYDSIELNNDLGSGRFDVPEEVKALK